MENKLTESEWISKVDEMLKTGEDNSTRKQILINLNYYLSNQWIGWDGASRTVRALPHDGQERITHNVIQPRVMTKLAKQTKNRIKYDVTPDTADQTRIEIAKAATKFIHAWWDTEDMDLKTRDIFLNGNVKSYCAAKVFFDSESGDDIRPSEGDPGYEEWKEAGENPLNTGEIKLRVCDPLTLYIDPSATTDDEIRWIVEEKPRDIDYVNDKYGKEVTADETVTYAPSFDISGGSNDTTRKNKNMVMVRELWMNPCKKYPKGLKVTTTRTEFLDIDENAGDSPYILFGDIPIPGSVKYKAFIESMLPIQRGLNIALTMFSTNMKKMGATKWSVPLGSGVDEEDLNDEISGIIYYNAASGGEVKRIPGADVPNGFDRIIEYYNRLIDDMSGAREIATGSLPAGLDTASGLQLMVEQENEKMAVNSQNYERGMKKVLKRVLRLMKKHYTEERMSRILGPDNEIELVSFMGSDLSGEEDINIVQGSSLPEMKSAQQDRIMTLWNAGAIVTKEGAPDPSTFLKMMGLGDSTELFEQNQLDENKSKMENKTFLKMAEDEQVQMMLQAQQKFMQAQQEGFDPSQMGMQPPPPIPGAPIVRDFYDHEIHIYNHNILRKSSDYEGLPPAMQQLIDAHVAEHEAALQEPIIAQQQAEAEAQQAEQESKSNEASAQHDRALELKSMDNQSKVQSEQIKSQTALQAAGMRQM
ncbi:phage portal protein [Paenibacillus sp. FSL R10-2734]|uniref:portal protein n=1 Tax=Paenibacillus sp. FSL R10-2734 TaxID=2954691 RepID=UPI0030DABC2A